MIPVMRMLETLLRLLQARVGSTILTQQHLLARTPLDSMMMIMYHQAEAPVLQVAIDSAA